MKTFNVLFLIFFLISLATSVRVNKVGIEKTSVEKLKLQAELQLCKSKCSTGKCACQIGNGCKCLCQNCQK